MADPVCDDIHTTLPLELYTVTFDSPYYTTTQGRKKLNALQEEIQALASIRHPNLLSVFAVKLVNMHPSSPNPNTPITPIGSGGSSPPQLMILTERMPGLTLQDVLEDCASVREDRASVHILFFFRHFVWCFLLSLTDEMLF